MSSSSRKILLRNRKAMIGLGLLVLLFVVAALAPFISPYNPGYFDASAMLQPPSSTHLLGTTEIGEDVLSLVIWGSRISLLVGFLAASIAVVVGTTTGIFAGFMGGAFDEVLMRLTDFFLVVPAVILAIIVAAVFGNSLIAVVFIIGLLSWPSTARIVRSATLVYKHMAFVEASKGAGSSSLHIMQRHILPNVMPLVYANTALTIASAIFTQSALVFLGVGDVNDVSWGQTLHFAYASGAILAGAYWYAIPPGIMIVVAILGFALVGYALDEILNPRLRGARLLGSA